jgi:hypothetical protein
MELLSIHRAGFCEIYVLGGGVTKIVRYDLCGCLTNTSDTLREDLCTYYCLAIIVLHNETDFSVRYELRWKKQLSIEHG